MTNKSIYNLSREALENYFLSKNLAKFRATQVFEALYRQKKSSFEEIKNINKDVKKILSDDFSFDFLTEVKKEESVDGTTKFLFSLDDGA